MGMYTEFFITARIEDNPVVVEVLKRLTSGLAAERAYTWPEHEFFKCDRFTHIFNTCSYYFTPTSVCNFIYDSTGRYWSLVAYSSLKNYDDEIEKFFNWINPYVDQTPEVMIGYSRYEESPDPVIYHKI